MKIKQVESDGVTHHDVEIPHTDLVVNFGGRKLMNLADPVSDTDGATKKYTDDKKLNELSH